METECDVCNGKGHNLVCRICEEPEYYCQCDMDVARWDAMYCESCEGTGISYEEESSREEE